MTSGSVLCHQHFLSQHFGWKTLSLLLNKQDQSQVIDSLSHSTFHVGLTWEVTPSDIFGAQGWALNGRGGAAAEPPGAQKHLEEPQSLWGWCTPHVGITQFGWVCLPLGWVAAAPAAGCGIQPWFNTQS